MSGNIRIDFVAAIAADSVTRAHGAIAGAKASPSGSIDDIFAAMLDEITHDLGTGSDAATVPASSVASDNAPPAASAATDTPTAATGAAPAATLVQEALDDLRARLASTTTDASDGDPTKTEKPLDDSKSPAPAAGQDNPGLAQLLGLQQPVPPPVQAPAPCGSASHGTAPVASDPSADPALLRGDIDTNPAPKPARRQPETDSAPDLSAVPVAAVAANPIAPAQTSTALQTDDETAPTPVTPALTAAMLAATATDAPASPMIPVGTSQRPAKAAAPAADSSKTQSQRSTAAALADATTAATRVFADQQASSALPLHGSIDGDKSGAPNHSSSTPDIRPSVADASPQAAAPGATPPAAPPPATAAAAQPHPDLAGTNPAVTAAAAPAAPAAPHAPAPISAQLQVLQSDPRDASPNLAALAVTIAAKSQDGAKHFDIRLDPPELGRVDVRLTVDDAGRAQAALAVEKPQTLELLQKDSTQLERALKDAGLDLSQNGLNFSLKGQQQQNGNGGNAPAGRHRHHTVRAIVAADATSTLSTAGVLSGDARLDIRV